MSLKSRFLAVTLTAAMVFSSAVPGAAFAAEPAETDPSAQEVTAADTSAQQQEEISGEDPGYPDEEESREGTGEDGENTEESGGENPAEAEEQEEGNEQPGTGTEGNTSERNGDTQESAAASATDAEAEISEPEEAGAASTGGETAKEQEDIADPDGEKRNTEKGLLAVNVDSCGGTVTVYDGETVYTITRAVDHEVIVTDQEGKNVQTSDERYDFALEEEISKSITVKAVADKECRIRSFTVTGGTDGAEEAITDTDAENTELSREIVIGEGQKTVNVSFDTMPAFTAEKKAGKYTVKISAKKGVFPEGTKAEVKEISGAGAELYAQKAEEMAGSGVVTAVIDIRFTDRSGKEIQPCGMVDVVFENAVEEDAQMSVYHAEENNAAKMKAVSSKADGNDVSIKNDSFSPYVLLAAANEPNWTKGGSGTRANVSDELSFVLRNQRTYYYKDKGYDGAGDNWHTINYDMYLGSRKAGNAVCLDPLRSGWDMDGLKAGKVYEIDAPMLVKALYYGEGGPGSSVIRKATGTSDSEALTIVTHVAASEIYARLGYAANSAVGDGFRDASNKLKDHVYKFVKAIEDLSVPDNFYVYVAADNGLATNGRSRQDFGFGSYSLIEHPGYMKIRKESADPAISGGNSCYSLNGALYQVYTSEAAAKKRGTEGIVEGALFVIDANGESNTKKIKPGKYYLIETRAAKGYMLSDEVYPFTVTDNKTVEVRTSDMPANDPASIVINKTCKDSGGGKIRSLEGTQFTVRYYNSFHADASTLPEEAERTWVIEVKETQGGLYKASLDEEHLVSGDDFYIVDGQVTLPLGTITIQETKAAEGYKNDGKFGDSDMYMGRIRLADVNKVDIVDIQGIRSTSNSFEVSDTPREPEIKTSAFNGETGGKTACAGEKVTVEDTVTYSELVPGNEYVLKGRLVDNQTGETIADAGGKEVTASKKFTPDKAGGAVVMEFTFESDSSMEGRNAVVFESVEYEGKTVASHEDPDDESQTIHFPKVATEAVNDGTGEHFLDPSANSGISSITDTVTYQNLIPGEEYTLTGTLMTRSSGEKLISEGKEVTAEKTFTPKEPDGEIKLTFSFNAKDLDDSGIVAFEELYAGKGLVASHKDIGDKDQTVYLPGVTTDAYDADTGRKNTLAAKDRVIADKITYNSLIAGKTYEICGEVKIKSEGISFDEAKTVLSKITGAEGEGTVTFDDEKVIFVPAGKEGEPVSGEILVRFKVDASGLAGEDLVVGETVRYNGVDIAVHRDLSDEKQTDHIPRGKTNAVDKETGIKNSRAADGRVLKDEFSYENLIPGETYRFTGKVVAAAGTDEKGRTVLEEIPCAMTDENGVPVEKGCVEFVPASKNGTLDLYFAIDAAELADRDVTVYEKVTLGGEPVIIHEVLDGSQTVYVPDGGTAVIDTETRDRISRPDGEVTIIDTLSYRNLIPGKEYTARGRLMKKSSGEEIPASLTGASSKDFGGESQSADQISVTDNTVTFTPQSKDGALELTFSFDGSALAGEDTVVFERVYYNGKEVIIHENIDDESQTVHFPDGSTQACERDSEGHTAAAGGEVTIRDRFYYENLLPGREYTIRGKVMLRPAGNEGAQELAAKMTDADAKEVKEWKFTPASGDGYEDLYFVIDPDDLAGRSAVVFETLVFTDPQSGSETEVVVHEDLNDEEQTIHFPLLLTTAADKKDGDQEIDCKGTVTVLDSVQYRNLVPGAKYRVKGILMNKSTGKPAMTDGKEIVGETEFTADGPDGTAEVTFTFDSGKLQDGEYVAFETLYGISAKTGGEVETGSHKDLNDASQTVKRQTPSGHRQPGTGDENNMWIWILLLAAAAAGTAAAVFYKKKENG